MIRAAKNLVLAIAVVLFASASQASSPKKTNMISFPVTSNKQSCQKWDQMYSLLRENEKERALRDGAVRAAGALVVSQSLVSDCELRFQMSKYFGRRLAGQCGNDDDKRFAASHTMEIMGVLRRIWPSLSDSKALIGDGNFDSEKYNLLDDPALESPAVAPLIADIIEQETIGSEISFVVFSRPPMRELKTTLSRQLGQVQKINDIPGQIYSLALLQRIGDPKALSMLRALSKKKTLSKFERSLVPRLIAKIERGEQVVFADVEGLEHQNAR